MFPFPPSQVLQRVMPSLHPNGGSMGFEATRGPRTGTQLCGKRIFATAAIMLVFGLTTYVGANLLYSSVS